MLIFLNKLGSDKTHYMRELVFILTFFVSGLAFLAQAQVTAVMQAKVEIISGSQVSEVEQGRIDLANISATDKITMGGFTLQADPDAEVNISVYNEYEIINELGDHLDFGLLSVDKITLGNGKHDIVINGFLKNIPQAKSSYSGKMVAVIDYL